MATAMRGSALALEFLLFDEPGESASLSQRKAG